VSSHVMDEADRCDRLLLMREGRIIADGTPEHIREKTHADDIEGAFLALVADRDLSDPTSPKGSDR
jgi:ABC-2 type transport system ATP-binding protein